MTGGRPHRSQSEATPSSSKVEFGIFKTSIDPNRMIESPSGITIAIKENPELLELPSPPKSPIPLRPRRDRTRTLESDYPLMGCMSSQWHAGRHGAWEYEYTTKQSLALWRANMEKDSKTAKKKKDTKVLDEIDPNETTKLPPTDTTPEKSIHYHHYGTCMGVSTEWESDVEDAVAEYLKKGKGGRI